MSKTVETPAPVLTESPIAKWWTRSDKDADEAALRYALNKFQLSAEGYINEQRQAVMESQREFDKARQDAQKTPDFSRVVEARVRLAENEAVLEEALACYRDQFGTEPRIS